MFPAWPASLLFSSSSCSTSSSSSCFCLSFCFSAGSIEMNRRLSGLNDPVMSTRRLAICWPPTPTCGVLCIQGGGRGEGGGRGNVVPRWKMAAADADAAITFQPSNKYNPLSLSLSLSLSPSSLFNSSQKSDHLSCHHTDTTIHLSFFFFAAFFPFSSDG